METKLCKTCGEVKNLDKFFKQKRNRDGYELHCKKCRTNKHRANNKTNQKRYIQEIKNFNNIHTDIKICLRCREEKPVDKFTINPRTNILQTNCNDCTIYRKEHYIQNKNKVLEQSKQYYAEHREEKLKQCKQYINDNIDTVKKRRQRHYEQNKEQILKRNKNRYDNKKEEINAKNRESYKTLPEHKRIERRQKRNITRKQRLIIDPLYKLTSNIRLRILEGFKKKGFKKLSNTEQILDCTFTKFKLHIEKQFQSWMTWDNHGLYNGQFNYGWDLDHIIPISTAKTIEDVIRLNHYTNFQPLCSHINRDIKKDN